MKIKCNEQSDRNSTYLLETQFKSISKFSFSQSKKIFVITILCIIAYYLLPIFHHDSIWHKIDIKFRNVIPCKLYFCFVSLLCWLL